MRVGGARGEGKREYYNTAVVGSPAAYVFSKAVTEASRAFFCSICFLLSSVSQTVVVDCLRRSFNGCGLSHLASTSPDFRDIMILRSLSDDTVRNAGNAHADMRMYSLFFAALSRVMGTCVRRKNTA